MNTPKRNGFRVAVSGHRLNQLPEESRPALQALIADALAALESSAKEAGIKAPLILVSALAEGADRFAAHAAKAKGWGMESPLPFLIPRYEKDFADAASITEFQSLLKAADLVAPIDGEALITAGAGGAAPYAAVGEALLQDADALLAVWNGAPKKGPGGTAEVLENALAAQLCVVWLAPDASRMRLLLPSPLPKRNSAQAKLIAALRGRIETTQLPPLAQA